MIACRGRPVGVVPVDDLEEARRFYTEKLGLRIIEEHRESGTIYLEGADGSNFLIYKKTSMSDSEHTEAGYLVDNVESCVDELSEQGVRFERYDMPEMKTDERGIAAMGAGKTAWFKDPSGNTVAVIELRR